jgi:hypothetical protein
MLTSINLKNGYYPYFSTSKTILQSRIDNDTFPYPRWFKGQYNQPNPTIDKRRAGWSPVDNNSSYLLNNITCCSKKEDYDILFQPPCSTVFPKLNKTIKINVTQCE